MKILRSHATTRSSRRERGAALLLSLLILLVLVAIVIQINVSTGTDARMAKNDVTLTAMDLAAESALLQELETLKADGEADSQPSGGGAGGAGAGAAGAAGAGGAAGGAAAGGAAGQPSPCDSRRDEWATPQRTEINDVKLRIVVVDEDSKYNVLNMLNPDEKESDAAYQRVVDILDRCRDGTDFDIDQRTAEEMAKTMREFMTKRKQAKLPRPKLLTDLPKNEDMGMPLSMREFMALPPFEDHHFKDFRDGSGKIVHSITSFLTVWSSLGMAPPAPVSSNTATKGSATKPGSTGSGGGGSNTASASGGGGGGKSGSGSGTTGNTSASTAQSGGSNTQAGSGTSGAGNTQGGASGGSGGGSGTGAGGSTTATSNGFSVNVNTAPVAVLHGLADSREIPARFWDKLVEWRNLEDEEEKEKQQKAQQESGEPAEEKLDEYGEPVITRRIFDTLQKLSEVDGYSDLPAEQQAKLNALLTTQSQVFSIYIIARKSTAADTGADLGLTPAELRKREETAGDSLLRVIHAVYWRQKSGEDVVLLPVLRWEVLDYLPYEVLDFPPDDR
jgi:hypothetical protein